MAIGRSTACVLALGLLAAACGSSDAGDGDDLSATETSTTTSPTAATIDDTATTSTEPVELTASWAGVTEDTIRLGFLDIDLETLLEMGLVDINQGDPQVVVDALVDELNDRGGILGRRVEAHLEIVLPIEPADAYVACLRLTDDADVFAVLGQFAGPAAEADPCVTDTGETIMIGGNPTPDQLQRARAPWPSIGMGAERRLTAAVELMHDDGLIGERVAVAYASEDQGMTDTIVIPELERLGYEIVERGVQDAAAGDTAAQAALWAIIVERFQASAIDTVVLVQSTAAHTGSNQLVVQGFDGQILIVDTFDTLESIGSSGVNPPEDLAGIIGTLGLTPQESFDLETTQECVRILEASDPEITVYPYNDVPEGAPNWVVNLFGMCSRLRLFELVATAAGADLNPDTFRAAAEGLGQIELPGNPFASLAPGKLDASDSLRLVVFDPTIDEDGGSSPYGPVVRVD